MKVFSILFVLASSILRAQISFAMVRADELYTHPLLPQIVEFQQKKRFWVFQEVFNHFLSNSQSGASNYSDRPWQSSGLGGAYNLSFDVFPRRVVIAGGIYNEGIFAHVQIDLLSDSFTSLTFGLTQGSDLRGIQLLGTWRAYNGESWNFSPHLALQNRYFRTIGSYGITSSIGTFDVDEITLDIVCGLNLKYHITSFEWNGLVYFSKKNPVKHVFSSSAPLDLSESQDPSFGVQTSFDW